MTATYAQFVAGFPEFSNEATYPSSGFDFWAAQAANQINPCRYGKNTDLATYLFVAHYLVLSAQSAKAANIGGIPGQASGPVNAKAVDKVSVGYDTGSAAIEGAGQWNLTTYGQRFYQLMMGANSGPIYVAPAQRFLPTTWPYFPR